MQILIPSRGRGPTKQFTYRALPKTVRDKYRTTVVIPDEDDGKYDWVDIPIHVLPRGCDGICAARNEIIKLCEDSTVLMLDDDLVAWSAKVGMGPYHKASDAELEHGFSEVERLLTEFGHGSIGYRFHADTVDTVRYNYRPQRAIGYNLDVLRKHHLMFSLPLMEDFEMALSLMKLGYASFHYYGIIQDQPSSNAAGGCSIFRTADLQKSVSLALHARFPEAVTLVTKVVAGGWEGMKERTDVRVQWAKWAKHNGAGPISHQVKSIT